MSTLVALTGFFGIPLTFQIIAKADFFSILFFLPCIPLMFNLIGLGLVACDKLKTKGLIIYLIPCFILSFFVIAGTAGMLHFFIVYESMP